MGVSFSPSEHHNFPPLFKLSELLQQKQANKVHREIDVHDVFSKNKKNLYHKLENRKPYDLKSVLCSVQLQ